MTDYNPSEDLKQHLQESNIISYRLVDGSYILAEEVDFDLEENIAYIGGAVLLETSQSGKTYMQPWLFTESEEVIELFGDKIVGRSETPFDLKIHYHRYYLIQKLKHALTKGELDEVLNEMFNPQVDNQDLTDEYEEEEEEWKIDNGISSETNLQPDKGFESVSDYHMNWRRKFKGNN
jgi:hypothetical protein